MQWNRIGLLKNVRVFAGWGEFGEIENYYMFGTKNVAVCLSGSYLMQGVLEENRIIIGVVNNSLKRFTKLKNLLMMKET